MCATLPTSSGPFMVRPVQGCVESGNRMTSKVSRHPKRLDGCGVGEEPRLTIGPPARKTADATGTWRQASPHRICNATAPRSSGGATANGRLARSETGRKEGTMRKLMVVNTAAALVGGAAWVVKADT